MNDYFLLVSKEKYHESFIYHIEITLHEKIKEETYLDLAKQFKASYSKYENNKIDIVSFYDITENEIFDYINNKYI